MTVLFNEWPREKAETIVAATKFIKFFVTALVRNIVCSSAQFTAYLLEKTLQLTCNVSVVTVLASVGLTKTRFDHQAILSIFSSRLPSLCFVKQEYSF